jgi:hypothetical protein
MKNMTKWYGFVVFLLAANGVFAQQKKPNLFAAYPNQITCSEQQLSQLFTANTGNTVSLILPGNLLLQGQVKNKTTKYGQIQTLAIQLPAFGNILLSVSKRQNAQNSTVYSAHLISNQFADGYQLKRNSNGLYQFEKIETEKLLPVCEAPVIR